MTACYVDHCDSDWDSDSVAVGKKLFTVETELNLTPLYQNGSRNLEDLFCLVYFLQCENLEIV